MPLTPLRRVLPGGVTVLAQHNPATPAVSLVASLGAGAADDEPGREGTAALLARMLDRGTTSRSAEALADELDSRGASLVASAGRHQITVAVTCLAADVAPVLAVAADVLRAPAFPAEDVAIRRAELITSIRQDEDDPGAVAVDRLMRELYDGHPYARRVRGTVSSVERIGRDDLTAFHARHFDPSALVLVLVGDVPADRLLDLAAAALDDWPGGPTTAAAMVPDGPAARQRREVRIAMPDKAQADIAYGFVGIRRSDPGYLATAVMNNALGQYALGGRLGDSIRERQGLAYYVYSSLDAGLGPGPLVIRAGVAAADVERTVASIDAELTGILDAGFTAREIDETKQYLVGALPRQLETNAGIAAFLLNAELFGLGPDYDRRYPDLVRAVTRDEAAAAARRLLDPARAAIVVAGPA